jgi:hypothetical protein
MITFHFDSFCFQFIDLVSIFSSSILCYVHVSKFVSYFYYTLSKSLHHVGYFCHYLFIFSNFTIFCYFFAVINFLMNKPTVVISKPTSSMYALFTKRHFVFMFLLVKTVLDVLVVSLWLYQQILSTWTDSRISSVCTGTYIFTIQYLQLTNGAKTSTHIVFCRFFIKCNTNLVNFT